MVFRIDLKIFIFLIILYCTRQIEIYSIIMLFAFLHELGHLLAGILLKMKVKGISILPTGFSIEFNLTELDYNKKILKSNILEVKKIIVALAGPLVNILVIAITLIFQNEKLSNIIYANIIIVIFNLLPIYPLDGGRILKEILHIKLGKRKSMIITQEISEKVLCIFAIFVSIFVLFYHNISIVIVLGYLGFYVIKNHKQIAMKEKIYNKIEKYNNLPLKSIAKIN